MVVDKCNSRLSCGSLSPIEPEQRYSRYKYGVNDVRIVVTDSYNNNSVFLNKNDIEAEEDGTETHKFHTALGSRLSQSPHKFLNTSAGPSKAG